MKTPQGYQGKARRGSKIVILSEFDRPPADGLASPKIPMSPIDNWRLKAFSRTLVG